MGLDMYAYVGRPNQRNEFYDQEDINYNPETDDWDVPVDGIQKPREIAFLIDGFLNKKKQRLFFGKILVV